MSAPSGDGVCGKPIVSRKERAPHLLTPSCGIYSAPRQPEAVLHCTDCGSPIKNSGVWNRPLFVCLNHDCPACPYEPAPVNTSFAVVEGM